MPAWKKCIVYRGGVPWAVRYVDDELPGIYFDAVPPAPEEAEKLPPCRERGA